MFLRSYNHQNTTKYMQHRSNQTSTTADQWHWLPAGSCAGASSCMPTFSAFASQVHSFLHVENISSLRWHCMICPHLRGVLTAASGTLSKGQRLQTSSWLPRCKLSRVTLPPLERVKYAQITCAITTRYYAVQISAWTFCVLDPYI